MHRILLFADDSGFASTLAAQLRSEGYDVRVPGERGAALAQFRAFRPDLAIISLSGSARALRLIERVRAAGYRTPLIVVSAGAEGPSVVHAFRAGANDYVRAPIDRAELLARVEVRLRESSPRSKLIRTAGLVLDPEMRSVRANEHVVHFAPKEFDLLLALLLAPNRVFSRRELLATVWGTTADVHTRTVDFHVAQVRHKLSPYGLDRNIVTVRGFGFAWVDTAGQA